MPRQQLYADAFWDSDFCGSNGLDNLVKRLKDGREMCKDLEDFLKNRSKIEDEYSKKLYSLVRSASSHDLGTLRSAWETVKTQTDQIAKDHSELSTYLLDQAKKIASFVDQQKQQRKQDEDVVKKSLKKKTEYYKKNLELKRQYENKCRELENVGLEIARLKQTNGMVERVQGTMTPQLQKQFLQIQTKEQKAKSDKEKADQQYKDIVNTLDNTRLTWERDMTKLCETAEQLDIERFNFLHNEMWIYSNGISQTCVSDDQACELMRQQLERCDLDADMDQVLQEYRTGSVPPAPIRYTAYLETDLTYEQAPTRAPIASANRPPLPPNHPHR